MRPAVPFRLRPTENYYSQGPAHPPRTFKPRRSLRKTGGTRHRPKRISTGRQEASPGYLYLGNAHFQKKELDKAEEYYQKAIRKESNNADAYNNLAWLYYTKKENLDQAEGLARKAIELNPLKEGIYRDTLEKIREMKKQGQ